MSDLSFGRYEPLFRIAAGGMAEVYAARIRGEAGFEKLVAVKRMLPHLTDDPEFVAMFLDEGRLAANIASPHVVATLDLGRSDDGSLYIVMDLVVGIALSTMIRAATRQGLMLPVPIACEILAQAASGLDDAHEARTPTGVHLGIVHRDVSPQNVLVGVDGRTRVVDFGVARAVLRQSHTSTGTLKGKFAYFSPEQAAAKELDPRSDVFALGIVAWETLLGRRLFESDNPLQTITRIRSMPIVRPSELRPEISQEISNVVMKALSRDRDMRWESAGAFATALRKAIGAPVSSREVAAVVMEIGATPVREMQSRIEAAMASGHLVTKQKVLRQPSSRAEDGQATPSGIPGHVGDLPTLVKIALPPEPIGPPTITIADPSRPSSSSRGWLAGIAVFTVVALAIGVALASRADPEPVSTPLAPPPPTTTETILGVQPPPEASVQAPIAPPETSVERAIRAPRPTRVISAPPPSSVVQQVPPSSVVVRPPPPSSVVRETPPPSSTVARPEPSHVPPPSTTTRHPAGLAGDEAFDHGI